MRANMTIPLVLGACLSLFDACACPAQESAPAWKVGQEWRILVRQYGRAFALAFSDPVENERKLVPGVQYEFHVRARVTGLARRAGRACCRVTFTADDDAPVVNWANPPREDVFRSQQYTLTLDTETLTVLEVEGRPRESLDRPLQAENYSALLTQTLCFPVDWILARSDLDDAADHTELLNFAGFQQSADRATPISALRRSVSAGVNGALRIAAAHVDLIPRGDGGEPPKEAAQEVEQVWQRGEPWWRSFKRYSAGHIDLEAVLVSDPSGSGALLEIPQAPPRGEAPGGPSWVVGQEWRFSVKESGGDPSMPSKVRFEYHMRARVGELTQEQGRPCARVEFIAEDDAPDIYTSLFTLVVDAQTWSPVRFEYPKKHRGVRSAAEADGYRALLPTMPGFPLDWVVLRSDFAGTTARDEFFHFPGLRSVAMFGIQRAISAPQTDGTLKIKVGLWVPRADSAMCEVEQVWHPGELWWRSFRRYDHGHLNLEATRVPEGAQP